MAVRSLVSRLYLTRTLRFSFEKFRSFEILRQPVATLDAGYFSRRFSTCAGKNLLPFICSLQTSTRATLDYEKFSRLFSTHVGNIFLPLSCSSRTSVGFKPFHHEVIFRSQSFSLLSRRFSTNQDRWKASNKQTATYMIALAITVMGLSYTAVPLYRLYCQASGYGGTVTKANPSEKIEKMSPIEERELTIKFNADRSSGMRWSFKPQQREIKLVPGETALAFYTASNPTDDPITGIATYNVIPFDAGQYFNKIQCFCFEEQRLNPHEEVDMPVFFYIDPEFAEDPSMAKVDTITLSYTFFEAKDGETINIPIPTYSS